MSKLVTHIQPGKRPTQFIHANDKGGGGSGDITVKDEGVTVGQVQILNISGNDIAAVLTSPDVVTIYSPVPELPPYFNNGSASCNSYQTVTRKVSTPTSEGNPFSIGSWSGGSDQKCSNNGIVQIDTSDVCLFDNNLTTIEVIVKDANDTTIDSFTTPAINNNVTRISSSGFITVQILDWQFVMAKYRGNIKTSINIRGILNSLSKTSGRFSYIITHHNGSGDYTKTETDLFYDNQTDRGTDIASLSGITFGEGTTVLTKYLSGIRYYILNSQFGLQISDIDKINADSYPSIQIEANGYTNLGLQSPLQISGTNLTNWTNIWNNQNASYQKTNWLLTRSNWRNFSIPPSSWPPEGRVEAHIIDWSSGSSVYSSYVNNLIDTYNTESDDLSEYFTDEYYRRTSTDSSWDSTQNILTYDSGNNAQVIGGLLVSPSMNFSSCYPKRSGGANQFDYTSGSIDAKYFRRFTDTSRLVRTSATFTISGFTLQDLIDEKVKMWINIPGKWTSPCYVHGTSTYNPSTFSGNNDPIRTGSSIPPNKVSVSFGTSLTSLDYDNNYFIVHLELCDSSIKPNSIIVNW